MPSTVNGVGTHYYGKSNATVRTAACKSCNRIGNLESYDTRLWFVVVFIPIIPLGRKRIIDKCPSCSRHYAMNADVYEQTKQLETSASLERFRREPTPEAAMQAHAQLLGFHEHEQAADFRKTALARFPDHAFLRAALAEHLKDMSSFEASTRLYEDALAIDPDLPEARVGVAGNRMARGELDQAARLLDFLEEPGAGQQYSLGPIDTLSDLYQREERHEEAMRLAAVLLRELPKAGENYKFRKFVKRSEKALGRYESILPEMGYSVSGLFRSQGSPFSPTLRKLVIGTLAAVLLLGGLAVNNEYIRRHRTLHVVNATGKTAQVQVDDQPPVPVGGLGRITVAEGPHVVKISGPVNETRNISLDAGYLDRWFSNPAWVLNPGGEAVLENILNIYSTNGQPGGRGLIVGEPFIQRPHVDYIFTAAPSQIKLNKRGESVTKTEIEWFQADDLTAFLETIDKNRGLAMDFAEKRLRRNPNQPELLKYYFGRSNDDEHPRIEAFLKSEIQRRPVDVMWHRAFQTMAEVNKHEDQLIPLYDEFLAAEPSNAALIYLRGRIDPDWSKQDASYQRAIEVDPKLPWPWLALAARAGSEGRWDDCLKAADEAKSLGPTDPDRLLDLLHEARIARGDAKALVGEYRAANFPVQEASRLLLLVDALAASGDLGAIEPVVNAWLSRVPNDVRPQVAPQVRAISLYYAGKLKECADVCDSNPSLNDSTIHRQALLALGDVKKATNEGDVSPQPDDPVFLLSASVAYRLEGDAEASARFRARGVKGLAGNNLYAKSAGLFNAKDAPAVAQVHHADLPPGAEALVFAALADQFPARAAAFLAEAARFNNRRKPPYHLIQRAVSKPAPAPAPR